MVKALSVSVATLIILALGVAAGWGLAEVRLRANDEFATKRELQESIEEALKNHENRFHPQLNQLPYETEEIIAWLEEARNTHIQAIEDIYAGKLDTNIVGDVNFQERAILWYEKIIEFIKEQAR